MKVLFISPNQGLYSSTTNGYGGAGWIASLQQHVEKVSDIELAMTFKHETDSTKREIGNTTYYPICIPPKKGLKKLSYYWHGYKKEVYDTYIIDKIKEVIVDFKPDIVHIFGTESEMCGIIGETGIPSVIHIQGILNPIINTYFPPGINEKIFMSPRYFREFWLRNGIVFNYRRMKLSAVRELKFLKKSKYFFGRTDWDKRITQLYNDKSEYYHIDEILRTDFYSSSKWSYKAGSLNLLSTISPNAYKGLDLILNTAKLLKMTNKNFNWKVIGIKKSYYTEIIEKELGISHNDVNVTYIGIKNSKEIIENILDSTIYIHPSYIDNSPNSLCEAQYIGIPCLSTNVGGITTIMDNRNEYMVPANDPHLLASRILSLETDLKENRYTNPYMEIAIDRHNPQRIIDTLKNAYSNIINSEKRETI